MIGYSAIANQFTDNGDISYATHFCYFISQNPNCKYNASYFIDMLELFKSKINSYKQMCRVSTEIFNEMQKLRDKISFTGIVVLNDSIILDIFNSTKIIYVDEEIEIENELFGKYKGSGVNNLFSFDLMKVEVKFCSADICDVRLYDFSKRELEIIGQFKRDLHSFNKRVCEIKWFYLGVNHD